MRQHGDLDLPLILHIPLLDLGILQCGAHRINGIQRLIELGERGILNFKIKIAGSDLRCGFFQRVQSLYKFPPVVIGRRQQVQKERQAECADQRPLQVGDQRGECREGGADFIAE